MGYQRRVHGDLRAGLTSQTMGLLHLLPLLALCHGAALPGAEHLDLETIMDTLQDLVANPSPYMKSFGIRSKRETQDLTGFEDFPIPFLGAAVGVKYKDPSDHMKGGEAYFHIDDLQSHIPTAHSKMVKLHVKFDGGASATDGLFNAELDYHLEHKDGSGIEEGSLTIVREMRGGMWHTNIKTEAHPSSGTPILPTRITNMQLLKQYALQICTNMLTNMQLDFESDGQTIFKAKYFNGPMNRDLIIDVARGPGKSIKAIITNHGVVVSTIDSILTWPAVSIMEIKVDVDIRGKKYVGVIHVDLLTPLNKGLSVELDIKKDRTYKPVLWTTFEILPLIFW